LACLGWQQKARATEASQQGERERKRERERERFLRLTAEDETLPSEIKERRKKKRNRETSK